MAILRRQKKLHKDIPTMSVIDHKAYVFYRESSNMCTRSNVKDYVDYGKTISEFYKIIGENVVESKNGVFLKNLGYFGVIVNQTVPKILLYDRVCNTKIRLDERYMFSFVPISSCKYLKTYCMDYNFVPNMKARLTKRLREGYKYNFNSSLFLTDADLTTKRRM